MTFQAPLYQHNFLLNDPELIYQVLVTQADKFRKPLLINLPFRSSMGQGLFLSEGDFWRRQRKLVQPAFHHQRINAYGEGLVQHALEMVKQWQAGQTIHLDEAMRAITLIIVVDAIFQADVSAETAQFAQAIATLGEVLTQQLTRPLLAILPDSTPLPLFWRKRRAVAAMDRTSTGLLPNAEPRPRTGVTCSRCCWRLRMPTPGSA